MAELRNHNEPSMEEILASIRRIIVEDSSPPSQARQGLASAPQAPAAGQTTAARVAGAAAMIRAFPAVPPSAMPPPPTRSPPVQEAILDLTDRVDDDDPMRRAGDPAPLPPPSNAGRLNRPPPLKGGAAEPSAGAGARPLSDASLSASVATLTKIATIGQIGRQPELPLGDVGRTLEDMVRELLRPHMKEWLDANLPRLVERLVRDEINRLVREAQER